METAHLTKCIESCTLTIQHATHCADECREMSDMPGMAECAEICDNCVHSCRETITEMENGSNARCEECARMCDMCADECEKHTMASCQQCAETCRTSARHCRESAAMGMNVR